jgi:hypothetical protein
MSDFEDKLRLIELRQPAAEWHREISGQCTFNEPGSRWHQWLWPSPLAWAALITIWVGLAAASRLEKPSPAALPSPVAADLPLFANHLDDANAFWPLAATLPR